jgi:hypothetical protein
MKRNPLLKSNYLNSSTSLLDVITLISRSPVNPIPQDWRFFCSWHYQRKFLKHKTSHNHISSGNWCICVENHRSAGGDDHGGTRPATIVIGRLWWVDGGIGWGPVHQIRWRGLAYILSQTACTFFFFFDMSTQGGWGIRTSDPCFMRRSP